jgi:hypothetical protein
MKRIAWLALSSILTMAPGVRGSPVTREALQVLSNRYRYFLVIEPTANKPLRYIYADYAQHLHVFAVKDGKAVPEWDSVGLGSPITSLVVKDVDADGKLDILVSTQKGRVLSYDGTDYHLAFENMLRTFGTITCTVTYNLDDDPQDEVLFIADGRLQVFDGLSRREEWSTTETYAGTMLLVANVDEDPQPEIIFNTGVVIDSRFRNVDFTVPGGFTPRISLLDMDGDGIPELIAETPDFPLRVFDLRHRREIY